MKRDDKLYNVLFPLWMLLLFPQMWLVVLPGNFLIDSLVLAILMAVLRLEEKKALYKSSILKIFCFGLLSDAIGAIYLLLMVFAAHLGIMGDELYLTLPAMAVASVFIYLFNYRITFKQMERKTRIKMALTFAIATAPYTFLIPSNWIY